MEQNTINILIVDDHTYHNSATEAMLKSHDHIVVLGSATNDRKMYQQLKLHTKGKVCQVDVLLLDVEMPGNKGKDGIQMAKELIENPKYDGLKILCFSVNKQRHILRELLKNIGVHGYLDKQEVNGDDLKEAIETVYVGRIVDLPVVSKGLRKIVHSIMDSDDSFKTGIDDLTERESQIFPYVARGMRNAEIAEELYDKGLSNKLLSAKTIDIFRGNLLNKLGCRNAAEVGAVYFNRTRLQSDDTDDLPNFKKE